MGQCLQAAEPRMSPGGWIYEDDYFQLASSYSAVQDYRKNAGISSAESPILLVPDAKGIIGLFKEHDGPNCMRPTKKHINKPQMCDGVAMRACIWRKAWFPPSA